MSRPDSKDRHGTFSNLRIVSGENRIPFMPYFNEKDTSDSKKGNGFECLNF